MHASEIFATGFKYCVCSVVQAVSQIQVYSCSSKDEDRYSTEPTHKHRSLSSIDSLFKWIKGSGVLAVVS